MNFKEHYQRFRKNCAQKFHRLINEEIVFQADAARSLREIPYLFYSNAFMILFTVAVITPFLSREGIPLFWAMSFIGLAIFFTGVLLARHKSRVIAVMIYGFYIVGFFNVKNVDIIPYLLFSFLPIYILNLTWKYPALVKTTDTVSLARNQGKRSMAIVVLTFYFLTALVVSLTLTATPFVMNNMANRVYQNSKEKTVAARQYVDEWAKAGVDPRSIQKSVAILDDTDRYLEKFHRENVKKVPFPLITLFLSGVLAAIFCAMACYNVFQLRKPAFYSFYGASAAMILAFLSFESAQAVPQAIDFVLGQFYAITAALTGKHLVWTGSLQESLLNSMGIIFSILIFQFVILPLYLFTRPEIRARFK